ncbi:F-box associated domain type 1, partial [Arabidopsis suecica]
MTMLFDLSQDLVEEILSRVPITSLGAVRSTCKSWNLLSKNRILCNAKPRNQFLGFMMMGYNRLSSMRFNLHGILNEDMEEFFDPSIKEIGNLLNQGEIIYKVLYCDGLLLLCVNKKRDTRLLVWNPYLGQTRWIQPKITMTTTCIYALGYDNNQNHKILRVFDNQGYYEIYDFKYNSWRAFDVIPNWEIDLCRGGASVNGNTYFWTQERMEGYDSFQTPYFLICFDFTAERFGQVLPLPFQHHDDDENTGILSFVKEEKLSVLYQCMHSSFNKTCDGFFIDEDKKVVVVFDLDEQEDYINAYIIGENICLKKVDLGEVRTLYCPIVCSSSYVPSLVKIKE